MDMLEELRSMAEPQDKEVEPATPGTETSKQSETRDKREVVEGNDGNGSSHISDSEISPEEVSLTADVSADVAPAVEEFMDQAKQQNEAAADAVPEVRNKPGSYISFEKVSKSFGNVVVLEEVSFCVLPGETLCILGRSGVGKSVS